MGVVWLDFRVNDLERAQEFYRRVLGWSFEPIEDAAVTIMDGSQVIGMISAAAGDASGPSETGAVLYFDVPDLTAALQVATSMGATIEFGPADDDTGASFADIRDPVGLRIGLLQESALPTAESGD